jgi:hypothetical protein
MPTINITEIRKRLRSFAKEHATDTDEKQHAQQFWRDFYACFGLSKSSASMFEARVVKIGGKKGYIDSFIPSVLLVEHKSLGKDLAEGYRQAQEYFHAITNDFERPQYIIVSDFQSFHLYNLAVSAKEPHICKLDELADRADWFMFLADNRVDAITEETPINRKAAYQISLLHKKLLDNKFMGRDLEVFLTRLLFCLFADDTGIFGADGQFRRLIEQTRQDGADTGTSFAQLFQVLNTPVKRRQTNLDDSLMAFEYVNGELFAQTTQIPFFDSELRRLLLDCVKLDWSAISPAIFGAMFQAVLEDGAVDNADRKQNRRELGAHYTSERNILKVIEPLFLDELRAEFERAKNNKTRLQALYDKLPTLNFFDPACGCGNFLVIAYRELRRLENDVIDQLFFKSNAGGLFDIATLCRVNVGQFYGIEIDEAAAHIARVALYITDHQQNIESARRFGTTRATVPLVTTPHILHDNALQADWQALLPAQRCSYVMGNPPFIGYSVQSAQQKADMDLVFAGLNGAGVLDYVCAWYEKASIYLMPNMHAEFAFVSTNSIAQGEQPAVLWKNLRKRCYQIKFAHQTFKWNNEGKGIAAVHCVVIGLSRNAISKKILFKYSDIAKEAISVIANNINAYLFDADDILLEKRRQPLSANAPVMTRGSSPIDGGNLLLTTEEKDELLLREPQAERWLKKYLMGDEFINGVERWCLWLENITAIELKSMPSVLARVEKVKAMRLASKKVATTELAKTPTIFGEIRRSKTNEYLAIPKVSSERRTYIPIAYLTNDTVCGDKLFFVSDANPFVFGIITSSMHMAWMRAVCGRMKSDYSYSNTIVYNNFPFPRDKAISNVENTAEGILAARENYPTLNLSQLYDPLTMPVELVKAHEANNRAVDKAYGYKGGDDDASRVAFLFKLYEQMTSLLPPTPVKRSRKLKTA